MRDVSQEHIAIRLRSVSKKYKLYSSPIDRLREALHPLRTSLHSEHWALRDVSLSIEKGETVGVMGRNGAGKSTLLQIITSVLEPSSGTKIVRGKVSALLELGAGFSRDLTGRQNVLAQAPLLGLSRRAMMERLPGIEQFADVGAYIDQPVRTYSSGMFVRLAFALAVSNDPDILIVDEALAVGDASFQEKCFLKLKEFKDRGKTFLLVSHSAGMISQLCDRVAILENGELHFVGPTQEALVRYGQLIFSSHLPESDVAALASRRVETKSIAVAVVDASSWDDSAILDRVAEREGYNPAERRSGDGRAQILDFQISIAGEAVGFRVGFGEDVDIFLRCQFKEKIERPRLAFSIQTPLGFLVHGVNTRMQHTEVPSAGPDELRTYRFRFMNRLAPGEYMVSLWLMEETFSGPIRLDTRESVIIMESTGTVNFNGIVDLDAGFSEVSANIPAAFARETVPEAKPTDLSVGKS